MNENENNEVKKKENDTKIVSNQIDTDDKNKLIVISIILVLVIIISVILIICSRNNSWLSPDKDKNNNNADSSLNVDNGDNNFENDNDIDEEYKDLPKIYIFKSSHHVSKDVPKTYSDDLIGVYQCKTDSCYMHKPGSGRNAIYDKNYAVIYDNGYILYKFKDKSIKNLDIPVGEYSYMEIDYNKKDEPVAIFIDDKQLYSIEKSKVIINSDSGTIIEDLQTNSNNYYRVMFDDKYAVYSSADEKPVMDNLDLLLCYHFVEGNNTGYLFEYYHEEAGGLYNIRKIYTLDNKIIYLNDDEDNNNLPLLDNNDNIYIIDDEFGFVKKYNSKGKLLSTLDGYENVLPGDYDYEYKIEVPFLLVVDNGKLNVIDLDGKVIMNIDQFDSMNMSISYAGENLNDKKNNSYVIEVEDRRLSLDDYTDEELKSNSNNSTKYKTRKEILKNKDKLTIIPYYRYIYSTSTKKVEKEKYIDIYINKW